MADLTQQFFQQWLSDAAYRVVSSPPGRWATERFFVRPTYRRFRRELARPHFYQRATFRHLMARVSQTKFGQAHGLHPHIRLSAFQQQVPVRPFEQLAPWIDRVIAGERDVLWPGRTVWFGESSGTSGPRKQIPITPEAWSRAYTATAATYLSVLMTRTDARAFAQGKTLFFVGQLRPPQPGSPLLFGDITALSTHLLPWYLDFSRTPDKATALHPNWEERLMRTVAIAVEQNVVHLAGMPPWLRRFAQMVLHRTGKDHLRQVWPNLLATSVGGVNPRPYLPDLNRLILGHDDGNGGEHGHSSLLHSELYNGTEGFYAMQIDDGDLALLPNGGIFYEFVPKEDAARGDFSSAVPLEEVETDREYAPILSTLGGLWRYLLGDTIRFTSRGPYRLQVTGRISDSINIAGEELLVAVTDRAMAQVCRSLGIGLVDYTVTAQLLSGPGNARHLWLIELTGPELATPEHVTAEEIARRLDRAMRAEGYDYAKARSQGAESGESFGLSMPKVVLLPSGTFARWLHHHHGQRIGSQSKVPRLREDPSIAESVLAVAGIEVGG